MFKKDDIVVRIVANSSDLEGDMYKVNSVTTSKVYVTSLKIGDISPPKERMRLATQTEINAYNAGIKNIADIKVKEVNNNYLMF